MGRLRLIKGLNGYEAEAIGRKRAEGVVDVTCESGRIT